MNHLFIILAMLAPSWGEPSPQPVNIVKTRTLNAGIATAPERKLHIDHSQADVSVTGWSKNEIAVEARVEVKSDVEQDVADYLNALQLGLEPYQNGYRLNLIRPTRIEKSNQGLLTRLGRWLSGEGDRLSISFQIKIKEIGRAHV